MLTRARTLAEISDALVPAPLSGGDLEQFYIDTVEARDPMLPAINQIRGWVESKQDRKILFAGHTGSGKSTELVKLASQLNDVHVLTFSVRDELDLHDLTYIDLVFVIMDRLFKFGSERGYLKDQKTIEAVWRFLDETTRVNEDEAQSGLDVEAGIKTEDTLLGRVTGLFANAKSSMKRGTRTKLEIRRKIEPRISSLQASSTLLINQIEQALHERDRKKLLLVVEDLDKLEVSRAREIFLEHSGVLAEVQGRILYTIPIFLFHSPFRKRMEGKFQATVLPTIRPRNRDGSPFERGINILGEIVARRLDQSLIEPDCLRTIILKTGGVLRDLFKAIEIAASAAMYKGTDRIGLGHAQYALSRIKSEYRDSLSATDEVDFKVSTRELYTRLEQVRDAKSHVVAQDNALDLSLACQAVLEYNGDQWFAVHPLVDELLSNVSETA